MGRVALVSFEQVCATADSMVAAGIRPTTRGVHESIGEGSMGTIVRHMQTWRTMQKENAWLPEISLDADFVRATNVLISKAITNAVAEAERRTNDLQGDLALIVKENQNLADVLEQRSIEIVGLNSKLQMCLARIELLNGSSDQMKSRLEQEVQCREQTQILLAKAEQRIENLPDILAELQSTKSELVQARDTAAEFRGRFAGLLGTQEHRTIHELE
jgi:colicin import membrane protein